jgi:hypothetical protein
MANTRIQTQRNADHRPTIPSIFATIGNLETISHSTASTTILPL